MRNITEYIIYEDNDILVCNKPAGVAVQTRRMGEADMESLLRNYLARKGESPYVGIVHRLDQPVEGIMVFAKNQKAAAGLNRQMQGGGFDKNYYAVLCGTPAKEQGVLEDYLCRDGRSNMSSVVTEQTAGAKHARLEYEVVERVQGEDAEGERSLVRIHLMTGRHHQIRVQFAHAGCPLCGDRKYNGVSDSKYAGPALCSYRLRFVHPMSGRELSYEIVPQGEAFHKFSFFS